MRPTCDTAEATEPDAALADAFPNAPSRPPTPGRAGAGAEVGWPALRFSSRAPDGPLRGYVLHVWVFAGADQALPPSLKTSTR